MCFYLNCWNVYRAPQRVININKSSKNEGPLWPHMLCFDSAFKMSESYKAEPSAFYIYLQVKEQWKTNSFHRYHLFVPSQPTQDRSEISALSSLFFPLWQACPRGRPGIAKCPGIKDKLGINQRQILPSQRLQAQHIKLQQPDPKAETENCGLAHSIWPAQHF